MDTAILMIAAMTLLLVIVLLALYLSDRSRDRSEEVKKTISESEGRITTSVTHLSESQGRSLAEMNGSVNRAIGEAGAAVTDKMEERFREMLRTEIDNREHNTRKLNDINDTLKSGLNELQELTGKKLDAIQTGVNERLDNALSKRLDESFETVGNQLAQLHKSLGELSSMSDGITSLNRTLSNVKTRGTWGEMQLGSILEENLAENQYVKNIKLRKNSDDIVEFAIRIPAKDDDNRPVYLPIDSKFPADIYNKLIDAADAGDKDAIDSARKELEFRIKQEARSIRDKYIAPPATTDFAVMFLPTESMYAEVLRIDGLAEYCQTQCRIMIASPQTITALLNSLKVGFANIALNKKTAEVRKLLSAIKSQYETLDGLIDDTKKKLEAAAKSNDAIKYRTEQINKKLKTIDSLETAEADRLLEIGGDQGD